MARYFFNLNGGIDDIGLDFESEAAARTQALKLLGRLLQDHADVIESAGSVRLDVARGDDPICSLTLTLADLNKHSPELSLLLHQFATSDRG